MILPCGNLPYFWEHLHQICTQDVLSQKSLGTHIWSYPEVFCLIFGSFCTKFVHTMFCRKKVWGPIFDPTLWYFALFLGAFAPNLYARCFVTKKSGDPYLILPCGILPYFLELLHQICTQVVLSQKSLGTHIWSYPVVICLIFWSFCTKFVCKMFCCKKVWVPISYPENLT